MNLQDNEIQPISLIDILTRNLLLLSIMFVAIGLGLAVQILDKHSLDCYFLQIQSERLGFIFFIVVAACYVSLLFLILKRQWLNFFIQLLVTFVLFVLLLFLFNPNLRVDVYLGKYHGEFATRSWDKVQDLPIAEMVTFKWLEMPNQVSTYFSMGIICPESYNYFLLNFIFTSYYELPLDEYSTNQIKTGVACNKTTLKLAKQVPSREKALLEKNYKAFLQLDNNLDSKRLRETPLAIPIAILPVELQEQLQIFAKLNHELLTQEMVTPIVIRAIVEKTNGGK